MEFVAEVHYPTVAIIIQIVDGVAVFFFRERIYRVLQVEQLFYLRRESLCQIFRPGNLHSSRILSCITNMPRLIGTVSQDFWSLFFFLQHWAHYEQAKKVALFVMFRKYICEIQIFATLFLL